MSEHAKTSAIGDPIAGSQLPYRDLGLTDNEFNAIQSLLGRDPTPVELAMYSVMWSEHCSYKSSRVHLGALPSTGPQVLVGPGENAGVVDVGEGLAIAIRIESHNHPSFVTPYEGAATGVGGILRDIFTMGARPIALMDPLFMGPVEDPHSRYIFDGVVRGIAGYGNSVGVPTVGGQITFDTTYRGNPLVNVFCLGILRVENLVLAKAKGSGNLALLLGSRTGRDGIGGVSVLASAGFSDTAHEKRPSVQVGDPYEEKRLIEACMELLDRHLIVAIQDLGGAGLACGTSELAARGGVGLDVDVDAVPRREANMSAVEVMTSESQERMLAVVTPKDLDEVLALCRRWEVEATVIGTVTDPVEGRGMLTVKEHGEVVASVPAASLADDAPRYRRPIERPDRLEALKGGDPDLVVSPADLGVDLCRLLFDASPIYRQYEHQLFLNTVLGPGQADAAVLRLAGPGIASSGRGLSLSADANPGWCKLDPFQGTAATVAESALNVAVTGARPLALVNCLNFGNPEHPEVMWELTESIAGMSAACRALGIPVVGGNVSLYNTSDDNDIVPTPVVVTVGLIDKLTSCPPALCWSEGEFIVLVGAPPRSLAGSRFARDLYGLFGGVLGPVDFELHATLCSFVERLVAAENAEEPPGLIGAIHDVSDGGLGVALAELACHSGVGCRLDEALDHKALFSESPSRVVIATGDPQRVLHEAESVGLPVRVLGTVGSDRFKVPDTIDLSVEELRRASRSPIAEVFDPDPSTKTIS